VTVESTDSKILRSLLFSSDVLQVEEVSHRGRRKGRKGKGREGSYPHQRLLDPPLALINIHVCLP